MRLDEMVLVHPFQITKQCSKCQQEVGIYPSGQRLLTQYAGKIDIICNHCYTGPGGRLAPGAEYERMQSVVRRSLVDAQRE